MEKTISINSDFMFKIFVSFFVNTISLWVIWFNSGFHNVHLNCKVFNILLEFKEQKIPRTFYKSLYFFSIIRVVHLLMFCLFNTHQWIKGRILLMILLLHSIGFNCTDMLSACRNLIEAFLNIVNFNGIKFRVSHYTCDPWDF